MECKCGGKIVWCEEHYKNGSSNWWECRKCKKKWNKIEDLVAEKEQQLSKAKKTIQDIEEADRTSNGAVEFVDRTRVILSKHNE